MMSSPDLQLRVGTAPCDVFVRPEGLAEIGPLLAERVPVGKLLLVTDSNVGPLYAEAAVGSLRAAGFAVKMHTIAAGEASKCLAVAQKIYEQLAGWALARDGVVVALGGGVVSDLAGFIAATWMRGIRFAICPTTLEADVDACLGGKTAVNLPGGKNLVGAFHQPRMILVDPTCLGTLDERDIRAGLAESIKHGLIVDAEFARWHEAQAEAVLARAPAALAELVVRNLRIKAEIVEADAHEQRGRRILLNFGHTVGHAIEDACAYALRHGECVALGMLAAARLSANLGLLPTEGVDTIARLLTLYGLPTQVPAELVDRCAPDHLLSIIARDKKASGGKVHFVLLEEIGRTRVTPDVPTDAVREVCASVLAPAE
jgi:3-dehydroquinate synthase